MAARVRSRPRTDARGLGRSHQVTRQRLDPTVRAGVVKCCLCGELIEAGQDWDLDHTEDRRGYRGAAHKHCNRSEGARRGNAKRGLRRSRSW